MLAELELAFSAHTLAGYLVGAGSFAWSIFQTMRAGRAEKREHVAKTEAMENKGAVLLKDAQDTRIAELEKQLQREQARAEEMEKHWALRYEKNQEFHHEQASKAQAMLFECQSKCSELQATRDFGPILDYIKQQEGIVAKLAEDRKKQTEVNQEIFGALRNVNEALGRLVGTLERK
jgi:hypothetical protein